MTDYLYHYTSLETLELILQNKTFRLSSLNRMDDLDEGETTDLQKLGKFIYISSWTKNSDESLLLWGYSRGKSGVRIKMKADIFKTEYIKTTIMLHGREITIDADFNIGILDMMKDKNVIFMPTTVELAKVTYTDLERLLKPTVHKNDEISISIKTEDLGLFKRTQWQDQKEWRYMIKSMPFNILEFNKLIYQQDNGQYLIQELTNREDLGFIDLPLKDDAFEGLEIMNSPSMSNENKLKLNSILEKYFPEASVIDSELRIR